MDGVEAFGDELLDPLADELVAFVAEDLLDLGVRQLDPPLRPDAQDRVGRELQQLLELVLGLVALGDVADRGECEAALARLDRGERDLAGEFASVLAPGVELESGAHRAGAGIAEVSGAVAFVDGVEALGDQLLDPLAHQFVALVAEDLLDLGVDELDPPRAPTPRTASGANSSNCSNRSPVLDEGESVSVRGAIMSLDFLASAVRALYSVGQSASSNAIDLTLFARNSFR